MYHIESSWRFATGSYKQLRENNNKNSNKILKP